MAVLDARIRMRVVQGLRVVDRSAVPDINTGNTNAPTMGSAIGAPRSSTTLEAMLHSQGAAGAAPPSYLRTARHSRSAFPRPATSDRRALAVAAGRMNDRLWHAELPRFRSTDRQLWAECARQGLPRAVHGARAADRREEPISDIRHFHSERMRSKSCRVRIVGLAHIVVAVQLRHSRHL